MMPFTPNDCAPAEPPEATPIWFDALIASESLAIEGREGASIRWSCVSGKAVYTNRGLEPETILPLGIELRSGCALIISWTPGETSYTVEVHGPSRYSAAA